MCRTILLPTALVALLSSAVAVAAVKEWNASAVAVETVFEGNERSGLAFEEPGRFRLDSKGNVVILDKKLAKVFKLDKKGKVLWSANGTPGNPKRFRGLQDVYVDGQDQVWVLDLLSGVVCNYSADGKFLKTIKVQRHPRRLVVTSSGEIVTNPGLGPQLLDVYSPDGKYLRSFGERYKYPDPTSDFELNSGQMAAGTRGEVYFSFSYPPVIRAYSGKGQLLWETRIPFEKPIPKPQVNAQRASDGRFGVSMQYQIASLDLDVDKSGRILCLTAGTPLAAAFQKGSQRLDAFSPQGTHLGALALPVSAHRMASHPSGLFLLEIKDVTSLTRFALQTTR